MEQNCILAAGFIKHGTDIHPSIESYCLPPDHTLVLYADIRHRMNKKQSGDRKHTQTHTYNLIRGAHVRQGTSTKIDPALFMWDLIYNVSLIPSL